MPSLLHRRVQFDHINIDINDYHHDHVHLIHLQKLRYPDNHVEFDHNLEFNIHLKLFASNVQQHAGS